MQEHGMEKVKVHKVELLKILKKNREEHRGIFLMAQEGFKDAVITRLEVMLEDARNGKRIEQTLNLPVPMDQTKEYDRAIMMLDMSVDDKVTITEHEFACFVMDDWRWKDQFTLTNSSYLK